MQKTPVYLGIFALDPKGSAKNVRCYSKSCIEQVLSRVNSIEINQDFGNFD